MAQIPDGAAIAYPPGWRRVRGDRGTATAALLSTRRGYLGYLNITPRQGEETLADWPSFRVSHNVKEGDRQVRTLASGARLRFRDGHGSCVEDVYTSSSGTRYIEIACLVSGPRASVVVVGAAPPGGWPRVSAPLETAISALTT